MNTFLCLAFVFSLGGSIAAPMAAILVRSYRDERSRIESGGEPTYLPPIEELYTPPVGDRSGNPKGQKTWEDESPKTIGLLPVTTVVESPVTTSTNTDWLNHFISQTALIWGNQGSGKSWLVRYLVKLKKDHGYRVIVLDPDSNRSEWLGVESFHEFEQISDFLRWYIDELINRYKTFNTSQLTESEWRAKLWREGRAIAVVCEEVTTYCDLIQDKELLVQFFRLGLTKSRKQEMPLTFVSHNNTQTALGGIKGLGNLIDRMLQLELKTTINSATFQPTSSGNGRVKLDGSSDWIPVTLPQLKRKITNFGEPLQRLTDTRPITEPEITDEQRWNRWVLESTDEDVNQLIERFRTNRSGEPHQAGVELMKSMQDEWFRFTPPSSEPRFTRFDLTVQAVRELVRELRETMNQTEIIEHLWGCKKGGSEAWKKAHAEYKQLTQED